MEDVLQLDMNTYLILAAISALISAVGGAAYTISRSINKLTKALTPDVSGRVNEISLQTKANDKIVSTPEGRAMMMKYYLSEASVLGLLIDIEERVSESSEVNAELLVNDMKKDVASEKFIDKAKGWFKKHKGWFAEKLFSKANDLVKGVLPSGKKE